MNDARSTAARILAHVLREGCSLSRCMPIYLEQLGDPRDRALAQELVYGVLRWFPQLEYILSQLLKRPLKLKNSEVLALLAIGLYQLIYLRIPPHAAVAATVTASRSLHKPWAASLVNAVLRNHLRNSEQLLAAARSVETAYYAHPAWLLAELKKAWPQQWQTIVEINNRCAPMTLRVNALKASRDTYLVALNQAGIQARAAPYTSHGVILSQPTPVLALPGFKEGHVSIQDAAAQLVAPLLDVRPGQRLLDACAAPGGKTAHILETYPALARLVAVEKDLLRIPMLKDTLNRLGLKAEIINADACHPSQWWDGYPFDRILIDAPCSGSGVIRRHPDIKLLKRETDISRLTNEQARLLEALWPLLAQGGKLVYVTCSVLPAENQHQIASFLNQHRDARLVTIDAPWGRETGVGRQILPGEANMDGFFYAVLIKDSSES